MNLDDLKATWNNYQQSQEVANHLKATDIAQMMEGKTHTIISKVQRNMFIEMTIGLLAILFIPFIKNWSTHPVGSLAWLDDLFIFAIIPMSILLLVYYRIYQQLNQLKSDNVRAALDKLLLIAETYLKTYQDIYVTFTSLALSYRTIFTMLEYDIQTMGLVLFILLGTLWLNWLGMKWYIKILYGKHIKTLKKYREEMALLEDE